MLNSKEMNKLAHDLKRMAIEIPLIKEVKQKKIRDSLLSLLAGELDRLWEDIEDLREKNGDK